MLKEYNAEKLERGNSTIAFKAGFWYVLSNFTAKAITFITTPIFARLMTPFNYGEFMNFAGWATILTLVTGVELYETLNRAYYDFKEDYDSYISSTTFLGCIITALFYFIFFLFQDKILKIITIPKQYIHVLFIFLMFSFCRSMFYARERTLYKYKTVAVITFISLFIPTLVSVLLVYFLPDYKQLAARIYGFYFTSAVIGVYCIVSLLAKSRIFKWSYCKYALYLSIPLLMHYLSAQLLNSTNVIITKNMLGATAAALISLAGSVTNILMVLFQALSGALSTWVMDNLEMENKEKVKNGSLLYIGFLAILTIFIVLLTPEVVYILGGKKYLTAIPLVPWLVLASFIQAATTLFTIILTYDKNVKATAAYTAIVALIGIILKIYLLPVYGLMSLVYANLLVFVALFFINYCLVKKAGYAEAVHLIGVLFCFAIAGILTVFSPLIYGFSVFRYGFLILFVIAFLYISLLNKEKIKIIIKNKFK